MKYDLPYPNVISRKRVHPELLSRGSVVAFKKFESKRHRTGIIVMCDKYMMMVAINLYDDSDWYMDQLPADIELYEANKAEKLWGMKFFLDYIYCNEYKTLNGEDPYICFIDRESPKQAGRYGEENFCKDFLSQVPYMLDKKEWPLLKQKLWRRIQQSGGLQFNRFRTEFYCYLIGVLMIAESWNDGICDETQLEFFKNKWDHFSWMYGMAIGRVIGSQFDNFTAVVNQVRQSRKYYLHLYLPLVENNFDKICSFKNDKSFKLQEAINKARDKEALEHQKNDLDELYHILFPKHFVLAMANSRPAATIADLKVKIAERDKIISKLQTDIDDITCRYQKVLEQLKNAINDVEKNRITGEDLIESFLRLPANLALNYYGEISVLFAKNLTWKEYSQKIIDLILDKQSETEKTAVTVNGDLVLNKENNIEKNFAPNIEHNGGVIALTEQSDLKRLLNDK